MQKRILPLIIRQKEITMNIETLFDSIQLPPEIRPCPQDDLKRWVCYREDETQKFSYQFDFSDTGLVSSGINIDDCYQKSLHDAHECLLCQGYSIHLVYTTEFDIMIEGFGHKRAMNARGGICNQQSISDFWITQFVKHLSGSAQLPPSYPDFDVAKDALQQIMTLTAKTLKNNGSQQPATLSQSTLTMAMLTGTIDEASWRQLSDFQSDAQLMHALGINIEKLFGFCLNSLSNAMSIQQAQSTVSSMRGSSSRSSFYLVKLIDEALILGLPVSKSAELILSYIVPTMQPKLTISKESLSTWCEERRVIRGIPARGKGRATKAEAEKFNHTYNHLKNKWSKNN
jgi:hypothetical protein